jgi:hypothetical protein
MNNYRHNDGPAAPWCDSTVYHRLERERFDLAPILMLDDMPPRNS